MPGRKARSSARREAYVFARYLLVGLIVGVIGWLTAHQAHTATPPWLVAAGCVIAAVLAGAAAIVWSAYSPPPGSLPTFSRRRRTDRETGGLLRVERTVERGLREVDRFNQQLRPWLIRLTEQRLRHSTNVDLLRDPASARELLGGTLWQLIQQPLTTVPTQQQLADWVAHIEAL